MSILWRSDTVDTFRRHENKRKTFVWQKGHFGWQGVRFQKTKKEHKSEEEEANMKEAYIGHLFNKGRLWTRRGKEAFIFFFFIKRSSCSDNDICVRQRAVYVEIYCLFFQCTLFKWEKKTKVRWGGYLKKKIQLWDVHCMRWVLHWQWKPTITHVMSGDPFTFFVKIYIIEEAGRIARVILQLPIFCSPVPPFPNCTMLSSTLYYWHCKNYIRW